MAVALIAPLFRVEYFANWETIDSTFIADARFLKQHWPNPLRQPLWYCGTRWDYIYPPALRYGTAVVSMLLDVSTARGYHIYTAVLYCIGIAGMYFLVLTGTRSRRWALAAAAAAALLSPSFLFLPAFRGDSMLHMPQRLNVLIKYGEGPHMSALALIPFALAFALRKQAVPAAFFCALVVSHNFYGAVGLAVFFAAMTLTKNALLRGAAIAALAYGFCAFWLTPSYLRLTTENLKLVAQPGQAWSPALAAAGAVAFLAVVWRWRAHTYTVFVLGSALAFTAVVAGHQYFNFRIVGEPHRLAPELDLALILASVEILRRLPRRIGPVLAFAALAASWPYASKAWSVIQADTAPSARYEYRTTKWIESHLPGARVFATGWLRLWYNAWNNGAQVGGGSDQGLLNGTLYVMQWQVMKDPEAGRDIAWLQAVGADAIAVDAEPSLEYANPRKFQGVLPVLLTDTDGAMIYKVPRRFPSQARIVRTAEAEAMAAIPISHYNEKEVRAYAALLENGPDREVQMERVSHREIRLKADVREGESIVVQESYDPSWRAGNLEIRKDAAGFMRIYAPPGVQDIRLTFELPLENAAGRGVTAIAWLIAATSVVRRLRKAKASAEPPRGSRTLA